FYINVPIGIVALIVTAAVLPRVSRQVSHVIDYAGTVVLAGAATAFVLLTTLGGVTYRWSSAPIYTLGLAGAVLVGVFIVIERRAAEPVLPLRLFSSRVFSASSAIGFVVGFAMFGAITYLPQYMQVVRGASPTGSGLQLLPLMAGLLLTSMASGILISRTGRYKIFPVAGTAVMTAGMYLLSLMGVGTSVLHYSLYMFVLGVGIGGVMQVLVIAVQNVVSYRDLGVATSGATFFRSIGGSFGTAIFGAIFANQLTGNLRRYLSGVALPAGFNATAGASPAALDRLPPPVHSGFVHAYAASLHTVFLWAVPISGVAFALTWLLKEVPLRQAAAAPDQGQSLAPTAVPATADSADEVVRVLSLLARREDRARIYAELADEAGVPLDPRSTWLLFRLDGHPEINLLALCRRFDIDPDRVSALMAPLVDAGMVTMHPAGQAPGTARLTDHGAVAIQRLVTARRVRLTSRLGTWSDEADARLAEKLTQLARDLLDDPDRREELFAAGSST
ncbi:MAG TPA: MFS transporter, partial [Acidimicrobiales bacterium]|nr:MFS transporter [Acidimicrobiales bacterium]